MNKRRHVIPTLLILLTCVIAAGCAPSKLLIYEGEQNQKELEAVLLGDKQTYIKRFDGADVPSLIKYGAYHGFELHVLPGYHDLTVYAYFGFDSGAVSGYTRYSTADLRFQAEAGKTYAIRYKRESASIRYWIEPVETQKQAN